MAACSFPSRRKPTDGYSPPHAAKGRAATHLHPAKASSRLQGGPVRPLAGILIDLHTEERVVGRSYLEPYLERSVRYLVPAMRDLAEARVGPAIAPLDDFRMGRAGLNLIGPEGVSMIAVSGLDMAAWDALAKATGLPLAVFIGGWLAPVPAYNSNGLWLTPVDELGSKRQRLLPRAGFRA